MPLASASFDPQLINGEMLQYCKDLIASIKDNHVLVEVCFHSVLLGDEASHFITGRFCLLNYTPPEKVSSILLERLLSAAAHQPLCHQTPRNRCLNSCDKPKESTKL